MLLLVKFGSPEGSEGLFCGYFILGIFKNSNLSGSSCCGSSEITGPDATFLSKPGDRLQRLWEFRSNPFKDTSYWRTVKPRKPSSAPLAGRCSGLDAISSMAVREVCETIETLGIYIAPKYVNSFVGENDLNPVSLHLNLNVAALSLWCQWVNCWHNLSLTSLSPAERSMSSWAVAGAGNKTVSYGRYHIWVVAPQSTCSRRI